MLVEAGSDVNTKNRYGQNPLLVACMNDRVDVVRALLKAGADPNIIDKHHRSPLFCGEGGENGGIRKWIIFQMLLACSRTNVNICNGERKTPMHLLVEACSSFAPETKERELLVSTIQNIIIRADLSLKDKEGKTPLWYSVKDGQADVMKMLLDKGVEVNARDNKGSIPAQASFLLRDEDVLKLLFQNGANANARNSNGMTPVHFASAFRNSTALESMLQNRGDVHVKDNSGYTPLHYASVINRDPEVYSLLMGNLSYWQPTVQSLLNYGAKINICDTNGDTPVHIAANSGNSIALEIMLRNGGDVGAKDYQGRTPLHLAAFGAGVGSGDDTAHAHTIRILINHGADVNARDNNGKSPIDLCKDLACKSLMQASERNTVNQQSATSQISSPARAALGITFQNEGWKTSMRVWPSGYSVNDSISVITAVLPHGSADIAGLQIGDIVVSFDGRPIKRSDDIHECMLKCAVGQSVKLRIFRDGFSSEKFLEKVAILKERQ